MGSTEPTIVAGHDDPIDSEGFRVEALSVDALIDLVDVVDDVGSLTVAVDAAVSKNGAIDNDALVALVAVLVECGVHRFETRHPQVIRRVLDTFAAISAGEIEVLEQ
ncbi:MAG: hypothetical protein ACI81L_001224 [Verrucomicrobiales bacterium]|jgi:hypothetical protein